MMKNRITNKILTLKHILKQRIVRLPLRVQPYKVRLRYVIIAALLLVNSFALYTIVQKNKAKDVYAFGDLLVNFGVPKGDPIFVFDDFKPGDCAEREIAVTNGGVDTALVALRTENVVEGGLADALSVVVSENSNVLYGVGSATGKKYLSNVYAESDPDGIPLSNLIGGAYTTYKIKICFDIDSGNEYQLTSTKFDIVFGETTPPIDLPPECEYLRGVITEVVEGTEGNDRLHTTTANELIITYGGDDRVWGSSGSDCIVTGDGNDRVYGGTGDEVIVTGAGNDKVDAGNGNDIIFAGDGNDKIDTGSGNDVIYAGEGNDDIESGSGNDKIWGEGGNDDINSGSGDDEVYGGDGNDDIKTGDGIDYVWGGDGNDTIRGGNDGDFLYGEAGNDTIRGQAGNDYLDGGDDTDVLKGGSGTDQCVWGENLSSCEI